MRLLATIGNFDGVHLGHRALLQRIKQEAGPGDKCVAITFNPHPAQLLGREKQLICTTEERDSLLLMSGLVDEVIDIRFTTELLAMPAEEFFEEYLIKRYPVSVLAVGEDFRFGRNGSGDAACLRALCEKAGILCIVVPLLERDGIKISSTRIRKLIHNGQTDDAEALLGHSI